MSSLATADSPSTSPSLPAQTASSSHVWSLPASLPSREVFPDLWTPPSALGQLAGKDSDPSRMGVFVCLLEAGIISPNVKKCTEQADASLHDSSSLRYFPDRPHLHPTISSLHKHRLVAHSIPLPPDPSSDWPIPQTCDDGEDIVMSSVGVLAAQPGYVASPRAVGQAAEEGAEKEVKEEWFLWRFSDEEAARRKAFLPLA